MWIVYLVLFALFYNIFVLFRNKLLKAYVLFLLVLEYPGLEKKLSIVC